MPPAAEQLATAAPLPTDGPHAQFEAILDSLIETHEQMLAITLDHRAAVSRADVAGVQGCISQQGVLAQRIAQLETQRRGITQLISPTPANAKPPTITAIADKLPEPARARCLASAAKLRDVLLRIQRENRVLRTATQSLMTHMDGLIQQVARALSQARLYGPQGRIDSGGPVACGIDLTH